MVRIAGKPNMSKTIEFWFDFSSPYAYFASEVIEKIADETGYSILWRPFLLGVIFRKTNMAPLVEMPMRGAYARHDWARIARLLGVPFGLPERHPYAAIKVSRAFYWIEANKPDLAANFAHAVFRSHFADGRNPVETSEIANIAESVGIPATSLLDAIQTPAAKAVLQQRTDEAIAKNVFGAPFFRVDGESFWGWDRMAMMRQWIERGGW